MFLCPECHKHEEDICNGFHFGGSHGACEDCGKVANCVDCHAYKRLTIPELRARVEKRHVSAQNGEEE